MPDLSGPWVGAYRYPAGVMADVPFQAVLAQSGSVVTGTTSEPGMPDAVLRGYLEGSSLSFIKRYVEQSQNVPDKIVYQGAVSDDGNVISGQWSISGPDGWSGTFFLERQAKAQNTAGTRETEVTV